MKWAVVSLNRRGAITAHLFDFELGFSVGLKEIIVPTIS